MRRVVICLLLGLIALSAKAQAPRWINNPPQPLRGNNTYTFVVIDVDAHSLDLGRTKCIQMLSLDQGLMNSLRMSYKSKELITSTQQREGGRFDETIDEKLVEIITTEGKPIEVKARIVDEYFDASKGQMSTLYQVATTTKPLFDNVIVSDFYGFDAGWRSAVLPGWGQFYKHDYLKGGIMLGGSVAFIGGILLTERTRQDYKFKYNNTHDLNARKVYMQRHNNFQLARNLCIGALAGLYIYNIVDAFNTPGAPYVIVQHTDNSGRTYAFAPSITSDGFPVAAASITF